MVAAQWDGSWFLAVNGDIHPEARVKPQELPGAGSMLGEKWPSLFIIVIYWKLVLLMTTCTEIWILAGTYIGPSQAGLEVGWKKRLQKYNMKFDSFWEKNALPGLLPQLVNSNSIHINGLKGLWRYFANLLVDNAKEARSSGPFDYSSGSTTVNLMQFKVYIWQLIKTIDHLWQQIVSLRVYKQPFSRVTQFSLGSFPIRDETKCDKNTIMNHWLSILLYRTM